MHESVHKILILLLLLLLFLLQCGKGKVVKVTGIANQGRTATVLLRGSNKLVLEEAERSLHDALCVIRCLVQKRFLITGGASPEVEVSYQLSQWSKTLQVGGQTKACQLCVDLCLLRKLMNHAVCDLGWLPEFQLMTPFLLVFEAMPYVFLQVVQYILSRSCCSPRL